MSVRQLLLKALYPILMGIGRLFGVKAEIIENRSLARLVVSYYDLTTVAIDGKKIEFTEFKGKNVLLVNTASNCGYTRQLADLEKLQKLYGNELVVIGFPSNDFKEQEKLSDTEIVEFCRLNFGVSFLLAKKSIVIKTAQQNAVFGWLTQKQKNGWNDKVPDWNFSKYLVDKKGLLICYFGSGVEPLSDEITRHLSV